MTISDATCSECGSPVADEKVEEVIAPTQLASSLLEDGSWLVSRLHFILREMGVPESEIAVGSSDGAGHGQMMVNLCGESFLLVTRDGDLTPAFARVPSTWRLRRKLPILSLSLREGFTMKRDFCCTPTLDVE